VNSEQQRTHAYARRRSALRYGAEARLDAEVVEELVRPVRRAARKGLLGMVEAELHRLTRRSPSTTMVPQIEAKLAKLDKRLSEAEDAMLDGDLSRERYKVKVAEIEAERRAWQAQRDSAQVDAQLDLDRVGRLIEASRTIFIPSDWQKRWAKASKARQRELIRGWLTGPMVLTDRRESHEIEVTLPVVRPRELLDGVKHVAASASAAC